LEPALRRLIKRISPPTNPRFSNVDWARLEKGIKLPYPPSFKEFVKVYGGSIWFDNLSLLYTEAKSATEVIKFVKSVSDTLRCLQSNMYDASFQRVDLPLYPSEGGLFPFISDYGGGIGCWKADHGDPEKWSVFYWVQGPLVNLKRTTIAKMILGFLEAKPDMIKIWGDVRSYEIERIRLTEVASENAIKPSKPRRKK